MCRRWRQLPGYSRLPGSCDRKPSRNWRRRPPLVGLRAPREPSRYQARMQNSMSATITTGSTRAHGLATPRRHLSSSPSALSSWRGQEARRPRGAACARAEYAPHLEGPPPDLRRSPHPRLDQPELSSTAPCITSSNSTRSRRLHHFPSSPRHVRPAISSTPTSRRRNPSPVPSREPRTRPSAATGPLARAHAVAPHRSGHTSSTPRPEARPARGATAPHNPPGARRAHRARGANRGSTRLPAARGWRRATMSRRRAACTVQHVMLSVQMRTGCFTPRKGSTPCKRRRGPCARARRRARARTAAAGRVRCA